MPQQTPVPKNFEDQYGGHQARVDTWGPATQADTFVAACRLGSIERSVQVLGTFGGAAVPILGSHDNVNFYQLTDKQGVALSFSAAGIKAINEAVPYIKPGITGGTGSALTISLFSHAQ